jgi:hypothetical protein
MNNMTVTIDIPKDVENPLKADLDRTGKPVEDLIQEIVVQHYAGAGREGAATRQPGRIQRLFDDIATPGYIVDLSREAIYADE